MQTTKPQLMPGPIGCDKPAMPGVNRLGAIRIELMTPAMSTRYSNQLSYAPAR